MQWSVRVHQSFHTNCSVLNLTAGWMDPMGSPLSERWCNAQAVQCKDIILLTFSEPEVFFQDVSHIDNSPMRMRELLDHGLGRQTISCLRGLILTKWNVKSNRFLPRRASRLALVCTSSYELSTSATPDLLSVVGHIHLPQDCDLFLSRSLGIS